MDSSVVVDIAPHGCTHPGRGRGPRAAHPADYASPVTKPGRRVAVVFGGSSVEHDVSIITAQQVMAVLGEQHTVLPIYVAGDGRWWTGDSLTDVASFASQPPKGAAPVELRLGGRTAFVERHGRGLKKE